MIELMNSISPLLATATEAEYAPVVLTGVLLSLVAIYIASKVGAEISRMMDFPPVLGELVAGVVVGISALHLVVFPESGATASDSVIMTMMPKQLRQSFNLKARLSRFSPNWA
jgi:hypothetical protein